MNPDALKALDVEALLELRKQIDTRLADERERLERELAKLGGGTKRTHRSSDAIPPQKTKGFAPQYRSKQDPRLTWAGRGMMPLWMRAEMKGTKLTKEDFRIP